jgi:hypothetical protein
MTNADKSFPDAPPPCGRLLDARLHLLDRQMVDHGGEPVGIVDDLDLDGITVDSDIEPRSAAPRVSGILTGQVLATRIFGGRPPRSKLQPLPWRLVAKVGTVVQLVRTDAALDGLWFEHWLRDHIIVHLPGGRRAAD